MKKSNENRLYLKKRLFLLYVETGYTFNQLIVDLLNLDETFKDEDKEMLLIRSLSNELNHICITLLHEKEKLSFDEVSAALYNHEIQKKNQNENRDVPVEALIAR
ncbi:hypothetical protein PanWU01x14_251540 [Parasponia andersonii]|uniref:Uncharacterized protein n=1 Tax=Parasponia andersonii TaxID=3476 RepID=A0A2P5BCL2_PARAD|nr:hypothetical protein PanWU01x14_251540 [Parasponia andersonii]